MALVGPETCCAVCGSPLDKQRGYFATSGVFLPVDHPLFGFCDAPIHWDCYAAWPHRAEFARAYFRERVDGDRDNPYWGLVYLSEHVAVSINPNPPLQEVRIVLADTGTILRVPLINWQAWCAGLPATCAAENALVRQAIETVMMELKHELPRTEIVINRVDWATKRQLFAEQSERERHFEQARRHELSKHQAKWRDLARAGSMCPTCGARDNIRAVDLYPERRSYFICGDCGRSFDPS